MNQRELFSNDAELARLRADAAVALASDLAVDATYRRYTEGAFDPETGAKGDSFADTAVRTVAGARSEIERARDAGPLPESARTWRWLMAIDAIAEEPSPSDRLVVGAETYEVIGAERDTLASHWVLETRRA